MMEFNNNIPIYLQIIDNIKQDIVMGKLKTGQKMPSVRELAGTLKVNPNTIQRVYQELDREKITFTKRGMGTYVTEEEKTTSSLKEEISKKIVLDFVEGMNKLGLSNKEMINTLKEYL
ncbi:GntR family transcriptional regulator [Candidatus Atribacteria bacterium HGW-Atribacteria-1]|nr:MAG: GntR family transcriptional regulator [Candidatus Atribacteria bacterium HGW-Atribacteria-1]